MLLFSFVPRKQGAGWRFEMGAEHSHLWAQTVTVEPCTMACRTADVRLDLATGLFASYCNEKTSDMTGPTGLAMFVVSS